MSFFHKIFLIFIILVFGNFAPARPAEARSYRDFSKAKAQIGTKKLDSVFLAVSESDRALGLMHVTKLPPGEGVLFVFEDEAPRAFWMKNTFIPLSIGHFSAEGCLLEIFDMEPVKTAMERNIPSYPSNVSAKYSLEVNAGWFAKNGIKVGENLRVSGLSPELSPRFKTLEKPGKCAPAKGSKTN